METARVTTVVLPKLKQGNFMETLKVLLVEHYGPKATDWQRLAYVIPDKYPGTRLKLFRPSDSQKEFKSQ
jgi:hypothetical protein